MINPISIQEWMAAQPLPKELNDRIIRQSEIEIAYNALHLSGNSLSPEQVRQLLWYGKVDGKASLSDYEEITAFRDALVLVRSTAATPHHILSPEWLYTLNASLLKGEIHSQLPIPYGDSEEVSDYLKEMVTWYETEEINDNLSPLELAALVHYRLLRIHPFPDGNGRMAQLMMNYVLCRHNYPMISIPFDDERYFLVLHQSDNNAGLIPFFGVNAVLAQIHPLALYLNDLVDATILRNLRPETSGLIREEVSFPWGFNRHTIYITNKNRQTVLECLLENPKCTVIQLKSIIGINKSAVQRHLKFLEEKRYIERLGNTRGRWKVRLRKIE